MRQSWAAAYAFGLAPEPNQTLKAHCLNGQHLNDILLKAQDNLWLITGGGSNEELSAEISKKAFGRDEFLVNSLKQLDNFDYVIVDTAPTANQLNTCGLFYFDEVIVPHDCGPLTTIQMTGFIDLLYAVQKSRQGLPILRYILPTIINPQTIGYRQERDALIEFFGEGILSHPIRLNTDVKHAPGKGEPIFYSAPKSTGAQDYIQLAQLIIQNELETI